MNDMATMSTDNDTPMARMALASRPEGIMPEIDSMDGVIENLFDEIQRLTDKVGVLLKPDTSDQAEKYAGPEAPGNYSEMRLMIGGRTERLRRAAALIYSLRDRIDL
jgi:hypothetical protein